MTHSPPPNDGVRLRVFIHILNYLWLIELCRDRDYVANQSSEDLPSGPLQKRAVQSLPRASMIQDNLTLVSSKPRVLVTSLTAGQNT